MKKVLFLSCILVAQSASAQDEFRTDVENLIDSFASSARVTAAKPAAGSGIMYVPGEGADAYILDQNNLFTWRLATEYWYNYEIDSTGTKTGINVDYRPNAEIEKYFPAFFAVWVSRPYESLDAYMAAYIAASQTASGSSYNEILNQPSTLYGDLAGWDHSYEARSGNLDIVVKSHAVNFNQTTINVVLLTTAADFQDETSLLWYALILASLEINAGTTSVTEVEQFENLRSFLLLQNYPNPFNAATTIPYTVRDRAQIRVDVFDINGRLVQRLVDKMHAPGSYRLRWDGNAGSGLYFYRITDGVRTESQRMILMK